MKIDMIKEMGSCFRHVQHGDDAKRTYKLEESTEHIAKDISLYISLHFLFLLVNCYCPKENYILSYSILFLLICISWHGYTLNVQ